jgi:hypothetical protein
VVVDAVDGEEVTWQASPSEDLRSVSVLDIGVRHPGEASSKRLPGGFLRGLEKVLGLEDNFLSLDKAATQVPGDEVIQRGPVV